MSFELSPGSVFAERYRIERRIASGGMGSVYEVVHLETNRRRALKVLHANLVQSDELRGRFRQEARVAAEIESEYIVDVFDAGIDPKTEMPFLVMELLRGEDVRTRIKRLGPLQPEEAVRYLFEASLALERTHAARIIHRDLKPDNLFLCEREHGPPRVKVLDFGIAKIVADGTMGGQTTEALGTPLYMAPEQFLMSSTISPQTDIFALGLIAYTMLVGKPYWYEESIKAGAAIAFALHASKGPQESAVARAARCGVHLPPAFDAWFFRATAGKPDQRYPSASAAIMELAASLGIAVGGDPGTTGPVSFQPGGFKSTSSGVFGPGSMPRPPMQSISGSFTPAPMQSMSGALTPAPMQAVLTPIGSGLTTGTPNDAKKPFVAIAAVALVTLLVGGILIVKLFSGSSTEPAATASPSLSATSAAPVVPQVQPIDGTMPEAQASATAGQSAQPNVASKTTKLSTSPTKVVAAPAPGPAPAPRTTSTTTKKGGGTAIWNND